MSTAASSTGTEIGDDSRLPVVLSVAFPFAPVGPCAVGGAEVILSQIEAALPQLGFRSVVVAHADSKPQGRLYPTPVPRGEIDEARKSSVEAAQQANIDRALLENPVVLIHMHGLSFHRYRTPAHLPVLVTLHLPPTWYPEAIWSLPSNYHFVCVSETERQACPEIFRGRVEVIGNGVPLPDATRLRAEGRYALILSRICPEKNLHTALDAARIAGLPVMLAGGIFPYEAHQRYFAEQIQPRLTHSGQHHSTQAVSSAGRIEARFLGPVTGSAKARLLARAACLLQPSLAPETSSLVCMEALASGVPVIAMASGAIPEIVEDDRTGFLIPPTPGTGPEAAQCLAEAMGRLSKLSRQTCRAVAEERFSLETMLQSYGQLYRRLALQRSEPTDQSLHEIAAQPADNNPQTAGPSPVPPQSITVECHTSEAALDALIPEWKDLWLADAHATPFQHPAWLRPWWGQFGSDGELHAVALRDRADGRLLGLLPLYVYPQPRSGERLLLLIGAGTTDHLDGLWEPGALGTARVALASLLSHPDGWDRASLSQLRPDSPLLLAAREYALAVHEAEPCTVLYTAADLPAKLRANTRRYRRRAEASGSLACTAAATPDEALASFDHLIRLHGGRWQDRGESGVLADARVLAHHREAIPALLDAGLLLIFRLTLNGDVLGILYALCDPATRSQRCLYLYLIGFDTHFAEFSPGTLLLHEVWRYARANGFLRLDLLRGGERYKAFWNAQPEATFGFDFEDPGNSAQTI